MKRLPAFLALLALILSPVLSQTRSEKQRFVYKTVDGHEIRANIFLPDTPEKHPVFIFFHGGGFVFGNRDGMESILIEKLLENGIAVISADYRLAPETKMDEILSDVSDLLVWVKQQGEERYSLDSEKIAVGGGSAGGYLALTTAFSNSPVVPKAIATISAPTGFDVPEREAGDVSLLENYTPIQQRIVSYGENQERFPIYNFLAENNLSLYGIFGFDPYKEPEKLERFTLDKNIGSPAPPTLLIHATKDAVVPSSQAESFHTFLQQENIESELFLISAEGHSSALIRQNPEVVDKLVTFIKKYLSPEQAH